MSKVATALDTITGGLSQPSKMPCYGWSISAALCAVGSALRRVAGTVCAGCYAHSGNYRFPGVKAAHARRILAWRRDRAAWVSAMVERLSLRDVRERGAVDGRSFFRWFDSGDLQGIEMLRDIVDVARQTPWMLHWLPTKEYAVVAEFLRSGGTFPENLRVRVSGPVVDRPFRFSGASVALVSSGKLPAVDDAVACGAYSRGGKCGPCRACWTHSGPIVYPLHR